MNRHTFLTLTLTATLSAVAIAAMEPAHAQRIAASSNSAPTRAEVLAELAIYRESGLEAAERIAAELAHETVPLQVARERHAQLRQGDRYKTLVKHYARGASDATRDMQVVQTR